MPAHFPNDTYRLAQFDGTALYEYADPREGFHQDWNTLIYNLGRTEVHGFMLASALHWLKHYHVDGLRVDAVASMLYRAIIRARLASGCRIFTAAGKTSKRSTFGGTLTTWSRWKSPARWSLPKSQPRGPALPKGPSRAAWAFVQMEHGLDA